VLRPPFPVRPLPPCAAGEGVRKLKWRNRAFSRPLPPRAAGEGVQELDATCPRLFPVFCRRIRRGSGAMHQGRILAVEHLHLPHEAAGVDRAPERPLAVEHLHLPHEAAGVDRAPERPLAAEQLHLPNKAAEVDRAADGPLAAEQLHLPNKAAGVDKTRLRRALAMAVTFISWVSLIISGSRRSALGPAAGGCRHPPRASARPSVRLPRVSRVARNRGCWPGRCRPSSAGDW
jgi:hypothetical protein